MTRPLSILFLIPYLPSPPHSGATWRMHGLMSDLARRHSVTILSAVGPGFRDFVDATREYCSELVTAENDRYGLSSAQKRQLQLRSLLSPASYERLLYHRPAVQAALDGLLARTQFDIVNVEFSLMGYYRLPRAAKLVLDEHNVEYDILRRTFIHERRVGRKVYSYVNYLKLRREEQAIWRRVDACALTSARDEHVVRRAYPGLRTAVVPNGVDTDYFSPRPTPPEPQTIVFFGHLGYYPNTEGVLFFLRDVMPQLRQRHPSLKLLIVGPAPPESIARWAGDDVIVTGAVPDVRPYLARASVVIVPLRVGGGTRLKIVEAMAMGKAVVSTTIGAEGIAATDGRDILLADPADEFAARVSQLLDDTPLARRLGCSARSLAARRYSWRAAAQQLECLYGEVLDRDHLPTELRPGEARQPDPTGSPNLASTRDIGPLQAAGMLTPAPSLVGLSARPLA